MPNNNEILHIIHTSLDATHEAFLGPMKQLIEDEDQNTAFKRRCGVEPGTTPDNSTWWSVLVLNHLLTRFQNLRPNQPTELASMLILLALCSAQQDFLRIIRFPPLVKKSICFIELKVDL